MQILFLHGYLSNKESFNLQKRFFRNKAELHLIDLTGFGENPLKFMSIINQKCSTNSQHKGKKEMYHFTGGNKYNNISLVQYKNICTHPVIFVFIFQIDFSRGMKIAVFYLNPGDKIPE